MACRYDCSCPSQLYHDVDYIIRRYNAPIPPPTAAWIIGELENALNTDDESRMPADAVPVTPRWRE